MTDNRDAVQRLKDEMSFHDARAAAHPDPEDFYNQGATLDAYNRMLERIGPLKGRYVLDFGCGPGWSSLRFAAWGARVFGVDLSLGALRKGQEALLQKGLDNPVHWVQGHGEALPFNRCFDRVIGISVLHHMDLDRAAASIQAVLKPGGKAFFLEPLAHNPAVNLFRHMTPKRRTQGERPLAMADIARFRHRFALVRIHGYDLVSLAAFCLVPFRAYSAFRRVKRLLARIDDALFQAVPSLQRYCWGAIIEIRP